MTTCSLPGCESRYYARGWCSRHYNNWMRRGVHEIPRLTLIERVMAKVEKAGPIPAHRPELGPCWIWTRHCNRDGYGQVNRGATAGRALVHRVVYEHEVGEIPTGYELDHLCRVHACCNPAHLEAVTHLENVRRGDANKVAQRLAEKRTGCNNGHPYEGSNYRITKEGRRRCRICNREWARQARAAKKAAKRDPNKVIEGSWLLIPAQRGGEEQ